MKTQSPDTTQEAELFQIAVFRKLGVAGRFNLCRSLSITTHKAAYYNLQQLQPGLTNLQALLYFVLLHYGENLAQRLSQHLNTFLATSEDSFMISGDIMATLLQVVEVLDQLRINYAIGGSIASSTQGFARSTADVDLVADMHPHQIAALLAALPQDFYASETAIREAITLHSSFNIIDPQFFCHWLCEDCLS